MAKRRITLNLDEDLVEGLTDLPEKSLSASANAILRASFEQRLHRQAVEAWMDELNQKHGRATKRQRTANLDLLEALGVDRVDLPDGRGDPETGTGAA